MSNPVGLIKALFLAGAAAVLAAIAFGYVNSQAASIRRAF